MLKTKGQSILEYTILAMLVIVTTMVMGPYLIRSINAHFKLWQEAVSDTVNDRMQKVPVNLPDQTCSCGPWTQGECGGHLLRSNTSCAVNQRYRYTPCSPPTCGFDNGQFQEDCNGDVSGANNCCAQYVACSTRAPISSCCGNVPIPNPANPRVPTNSEGTLPALSNPNPNNLGGYCYYGEEVQIGQCNGLTGQTNTYACKPNDQCKPSCTGSLPTNAAGAPIGTLCAGSDQGLTQDTPITLLGCANTTYTYTIPAIKPNASNGGTTLYCTDVGLVLKAYITGTGCGNPGVQKSVCTISLLNSSCYPSPDCSASTAKCIAVCNSGYLFQTHADGSLYCSPEIDQLLTIAPIVPNSRHDISKNYCSANTVNSGAIDGSGCLTGNPSGATPCNLAKGGAGCNCTVALW